MLKYSLTENVLASNPNGCVAVVSGSETKDLNAVIDYMIAEGTGLTRPQAMAYFEKLTQTIEYFVGQGHRVTFIFLLCLLPLGFSACKFAASTEKVQTKTKTAVNSEKESEQWMDNKATNQSFFLAFYSKTVRLLRLNSPTVLFKQSGCCV